MKIRIFALSLFLAAFSISVNAQDSLLTDVRGNYLPDVLLNRISIEFKNAPILEALRSIESKGNFHLNYNEDIIPANQTVSVNIINKPVIIAIRKILLGTSIKIIVTPDNQIVLILVTSIEQEVEQKKFTISGFITDAENGEALIGTNVYINELEAGNVANAYGFYSTTIPAGYYSVKFSYVSYESKEIYIGHFKNINLNMELNRKSIALDTVVVIAKPENILNATEMSVINITPDKFEHIPVLLGEKDVLRTLHLLPGVTFGQDGDCGIYVRGGNQDQNLILIDEAPVYSAFHSFGFFSVFNPDAIRGLKLYKGAAPTKYGGRIASFLDIQMNEGNLKEFNGVAGIGLIFSRFTIQGPIIKDKSSFIFSGRRTYLDILKVFSSSEDIDQSDLYFYDLNLKVNYRLSNNDRLYLSGYTGNDKFGFTDVFNVSWGNITSTLRWNHLFSNKLFLNSSLIFSHFKYKTHISAEEDDEDIEFTSSVDDLTLKEDFEYFIDTKNKLNFGMNYIYHNFLPANIHVTGSNPFDFILGKRSAHEFSLYASHNYKPSEQVNLEYGLRATLFSVNGMEDKLDIDDIEEKPFFEAHIDENKSYLKLEPRIAYTHSIDNTSSLKADFSMNHQYIHKLSNSNTGSPINVWQPSSSNVKPQSAIQLSLGYYKNFKQDEYEFSVEAYYKYMKNLVDYKEGAHFIFRNFFESEITFGDGRAYGIEFLLKKSTGNLTGWVGYTLSKSERIFPEINDGDPFDAKFSRIHDFSLAASYKINDHIIISTNMVFATGHNVTIPHGEYVIDSRTITAHSSRNAYSLPPYHRLDVGISYINNVGGTWNLSIYNVYGRKNTYTLLIRENENIPGKREAVHLSFYSIVPSLSYTLRF